MTEANKYTLSELEKAFAESDIMFMDCKILCMIKGLNCLFIHI